MSPPPTKRGLTQNTNIHERDPEGHAEDLVRPDLLVGHPVDDAVVARVHVPQVVGHDDDGERQSDHQPQHDVEDHGVLEVVLVGQVVRVAGVALQNRKRTFKNISVCRAGPPSPSMEDPTGCECSA